MRTFTSNGSSGRQPPAAPSQPGTHQRWVEVLAPARMTGVLEALDYLAQLATRRYAYTDAEWQEMREAIHVKVDETFEAFKHRTGGRPGFKWLKRAPLSL